MPDLATSGSLLALLSDPTRVRLLSLLADEELTVAELTEITELAQSRVSTHLGRLREAGLLLDRRAGASAYYRVNELSMPEPARALWATLRAQLEDPQLASDRQRRAKVIAARDGQAWPDRIAGRMERYYSPGRTWEALTRAFLGLVRLGRVLDVGAGDGTVAELLAARAESITCIERSDRLLTAAHERLASVGNVSFVQGDMHELPFEAGRFDQVLLFNVLPYSQAPAQVIAESARVLAEGGQLLVTTLAPHRHQSITAGYGHVNRGLSAAALRKALEAAGLRVDACEITSRERRKPHFRVLTAIARKETP